MPQQVSPYDLTGSVAGYYPYPMYPYAMVPGVAVNPGVVSPGVPPAAPVGINTNTGLHLSSQASEKSVKPCGFWAEGSCQYGEKCKYTHYGAAGSGIPAQFATASGVKRPAIADANDQLKRRRVESPVVLAAPAAPMAYYPGGPVAPVQNPALAHGMPHPMAQQVPTSMTAGQMYNPYVMPAAMYGQ